MVAETIAVARAGISATAVRLSRSAKWGPHGCCSPCSASSMVALRQQSAMPPRRLGWAVAWRLRAAQAALRRCVVRFRVLAARRAAADGEFEPPAFRRRAAALFACRESAVGEAAERGSFLRAFSVARERLGLGVFPARALSCEALRRTRPLAFGLGWAAKPERRAFESPIAIACLALRAPCFPSRMWCISSRMNSPAWVDALFPSLRSRFARSTVCLLGI